VRKIKEKICKQCGNSFPPFNTITPVCSPRCAIEYNKPEEVDKRVKVIKADLNKNNVFDYLQQEINLIVRLIDKGHDCISSGLPYGSFHPNAGHFYGVGANKTLRYHLMNIWLQSKKDNDELGGKGSNYGLRLKEVFGEEIRQHIEELPARYKVLHLSRSEASEALKIARQVVRELKDKNEVYSIKERISLRDEIQKRLDIYK
jgi:hypothetical protein